MVTAAHCLPKLPPALACSFEHERTYMNLLGQLNGEKNTVAAECLFVDPVADIAVLGSPDDQVFEHEPEAYDALTGEVPTLRMGKARSGKGWILALDGVNWIQTKIAVHAGVYGTGLEIGPTEGGMSGSPILNHQGTAVGVVASTMQQGILTLNLPGWLLLGLTRAG